MPLGSVLGKQPDELDVGERVGGSSVDRRRLRLRRTRKAIHARDVLIEERPEIAAPPCSAGRPALDLAGPHGGHGAGECDAQGLDAEQAGDASFRLDEAGAAPDDVEAVPCRSADAGAHGVSRESGGGPLGRGFRLDLDVELGQQRTHQTFDGGCTVVEEQAFADELLRQRLGRSPGFRREVVVVARRLPLDVTEGGHRLVVIGTALDMRDHLCGAVPVVGRSQTHDADAGEEQLAGR